MDTPRLCIRVTKDAVSMRYCGLPELNDGNRIFGRRLISPRGELMDVTSGYYIIYSYAHADNFYECRRNPKNMRSLQYQIDNMYCYRDSYYVIAKFADCDFTQHIDITLGDPVIGMLPKKLSPELAEQIRIYDAQ